MAAPLLSVSEQLMQLNDARSLVLGDANYYPQIIQGILPIIGPDARVELRRWGADFLAETFSSPAVPTNEKQTLSLIVLETLKSMLENVNEDTGVVKSIVQTAASIYPLVFRWMYVLFSLCTMPGAINRLSSIPFMNEQFPVLSL
jgi:symplekin